MVGFLLNNIKKENPKIIGFSVIDAINLDGGSSSQLSINSEKFKKNIYGRSVPAFIVFYKR